MKSLSLLCFLSAFSIAISAQILNPFYNSITNNVSQDSVVVSLREFESLGVKACPSVELGNTASWIISKLSNYGYSNIEENNFLFQNDTLKNIIATKTGTSFPDSYVIICGHYDTETGPGVNDNGTGVSIILEAARLLKNISMRYSIKFIFFSGEEEGYLGSRYYADSIAVPLNMSIRLVFNIDEVGGIAGLENNVIKCEKDLSPPFSNNQVSEAFTDTLSNLVQMYSSLSSEITYAYGSDYVPFQQNDFVITGLFEKNQSDFVHTINDSLSNLDTNYVFQVARASVGALLFFAQAYENTSGINDSEKTKSQIIVYPNPAKTHINFTSDKTHEEFIFSLSDVHGKEIMQSLVSVPGNIHLPSDLSKAMYSYSLISTPSGIFFQSGNIRID
ncbi:MAG: hypothetical protein A2275_07935 [Bacteroidetes bacterium RIFOXYA12_FULL_35_11]|nr:MAG: hypothetical protein A2X01_11840 [Bacteroidetes bacterium GWF2_35_48]OFY75413.1 MAG: hypothetical protein A2275_07935 [Bacteroidetes bacterium RIFOXYA12_FULL_35_11]OFY93631.1 MAG: hypothetical protein A2309_13150 [Bacteroidetes bacterium RIFOXYB2_FULL_35_7]OFY97865.1 MAG: hypothetical protein A2491_16295 [Bacteroidetes bacterium RIFOXYC12_FULL_35_7]HBX52567.1 leucyl aminopeptidase [Bacteroidales bacterium]